MSETEDPTVTIWEGRHEMGGYSRDSTITLRPGRCNVCREQRICLETDGSDGEYANGQICQECAVKAWEAIDDV